MLEVLFGNAVVVNNIHSLDINTFLIKLQHLHNVNFYTKLSWFERFDSEGGCRKVWMTPRAMEENESCQKMIDEIHLLKTEIAHMREGEEKTLQHYKQKQPAQQKKNDDRVALISAKSKLVICRCYCHLKRN